MTAGVRAVAANEAPCQDLLAVFGDRGSSATCFCERYKLQRGEAFSRVPREDRRERLRAQTQCGKPGAATTSGIVAYLDGVPVGWCAAVTCFITRKGYGKRGVTYALARAAVAFARERGGSAVEGYPMITEPLEEITWGELHVGSRKVPVPGSLIRESASSRTTLVGTSPAP